MIAIWVDCVRVNLAMLVIYRRSQPVGSWLINSLRGRGGVAIFRFRSGIDERIRALYSGKKFILNPPSRPLATPTRGLSAKLIFLRGYSAGLFLRRVFFRFGRVEEVWPWLRSWVLIVKYFFSRLIRSQGYQRVKFWRPGRKTRKFHQHRNEFLCRRIFASLEIRIRNL